MKRLGWNERISVFYEEFKDKGIPARIASQYKNMYKLFYENGELLGEITGKMLYEEEIPATGDWVTITNIENGRCIINKILPRYTKFSRKEAGLKTREQVISANIDTVFIVMALNQDYNLNRLERYISAAWDSGAEPVIILSKSDLANDIMERIKEVEETALYSIEVYAVSSFTEEGIKNLDKYFKEGKTVSLLGSSGAGKSTLINVFLGKDIQKTNTIREDDGKGRHTTTTRDLILLENGAVVIDNPGMREFQLWDDESLKSTFQDIENIAEECKFKDCTHMHEPGCAVIKAVEEGTLDLKRFENYKKLLKESQYLNSKKEKSAAAVEKEKWKDITKYQKKLKNNKQ